MIALALVFLMFTLGICTDGIVTQLKRIAAALEKD